ncbi:TetR/AcrR family transcriptional regulator, partial [Micrococcus sp. SIMBA_131]
TKVMKTTYNYKEVQGDTMNDRKQHVIKMAHQLFIERGFQSTSIQDILEYSGISKGTFYNYFSSKNELLIALFKALY